jgi:hypothetical protein
LKKGRRIDHRQKQPVIGGRELPRGVAKERSEANKAVEILLIMRLALLDSAEFVFNQFQDLVPSLMLKCFEESVETLGSHS